MSAIQTSLQRVFIECLQSMINPLVRLTLHCGLGHKEFSAAVRREFINVATETYSVRGRPANISRVSAKTGLPRKVISAHRNRTADEHWTPDDEVSPINTIIHYWRFDRGFSISPGTPRDLEFDGSGGFRELVRRYLGDIPASTLRQELLRDGIACVTDFGLLRLECAYSFPDNLDADFLRNAAFSIRHHAETLLHNAKLVELGGISEQDHVEHGWFERIAWSKRLSPHGLREFQAWARSEGSRVVQDAAAFIAEHEDLTAEADAKESPVSGLGVYFFGHEKA